MLERMGWTKSNYIYLVGRLEKQITELQAEKDSLKEKLRIANSYVKAYKNLAN